MRVLVCGDRHWTNEHAVLRELINLGSKDMIIIHGAARGADSIAGVMAEHLKCKVLAFPAQWDKYGRSAGPLRNQQMLDEGKPDIVLAFHASLAKSKGTKDMVRRATQARVPVKVIRE